MVMKMSVRFLSSNSGPLSVLQLRKIRPEFNCLFHEMRTFFFGVSVMEGLCKKPLWHFKMFFERLSSQLCLRAKLSTRDKGFLKEHLPLFLYALGMNQLWVTSQCELLVW